MCKNDRIVGYRSTNFIGGGGIMAAEEIKVYSTPT